MDNKLSEGEHVGVFLDAIAYLLEKVWSFLFAFVGIWHTYKLLDLCPSLSE